MKLMMAAYPEKFGDDVGAALEIRTREGSRTKPLFRLAPGIGDSEFLGEGELGRAGKGAWLASFRKSYIGWLVRNRVGPNFSDVSFYDAVTFHGSGYVQEASSFLGNRFHLLGGMRYDQSERYPDHPMSPQASAAVTLARSTTFQLGYGHYVQNEFPPNIGFTSACLPGTQSWETSNHYSAGLEQRIGENTRARAEAFTRQTTELLHFDAVSSNCLNASFAARTETLARERSKGIQFVLQRRSANRLSGWIGYTLVYARDNSRYTNLLTHLDAFSPDYPSFEDQRHSINAFANYRFKPTINFSSKFLFGSGFPISSGYTISSTGSAELLPVQRMAPYLRVDARAEKSWAWTRWKLTLYGEVLNLTNHFNQIVTSQVFQPNGQLQTTTAEALPITPTAGLAFEF